MRRRRIQGGGARIDPPGQHPERWDQGAILSKGIDAISGDFLVREGGGRSGFKKTVPKHIPVETGGGFWKEPVKKITSVGHRMIGEGVVGLRSADHFSGDFLKREDEGQRGFHRRKQAVSTGLVHVGSGFVPVGGGSRGFVPVGNGFQPIGSQRIRSY